MCDSLHMTHSSHTGGVKVRARNETFPVKYIHAINLTSKDGRRRVTKKKKILVSCEQRCYTRFPLHNITWSTTHMQSSTQSLQAQMGEWVRSLGTSSTQSPELDKELNHLSYHCSGNTRTQHMPERQMTEYDLCACRNRVLASQNTKLKYLKNFYHKRKLELGTAVLSKKKKSKQESSTYKHTHTYQHYNPYLHSSSLTYM